jgi:hypothetical protein
MTDSKGRIKFLHSTLNRRYTGTGFTPSAKICTRKASFGKLFVCLGAR